MAIRYRNSRGHELTIVTASTKAQVVEGISRLGYDERELFFKHGSFNPYEGVFRNSHASGPIFGFRAEYRSLVRLHAALPDGFARPVALLKRWRFGMALGYLAEYVEGINLRDMLTDSTGRFPMDVKIGAMEEFIAILNAMRRAGLSDGDPGIKTA